MRKTKMSAVSKIQIALLVLGFLAMEFPGILFFKDMAEPRMFGLPFAYGWMLIGWVYMCVVLFWCYISNWGEGKDEGGEDK
ncbi:MAG: hypothetical protein KBS66_06815 [Eubacterium sp.]|nr:hypothetical protein [Candidatus Colimonas fimequi]